MVINLTFICIFLPVSPNAWSAIGKRKFDGGQHPGGDSKRRFGIGNGGPGTAGPAGGPGGSNWGSQPLTQQPLGTNGEQWYNDTYSSWS